jgi:hypothetical protein
MIDRLTEIGRFYGMEMNTEKTQIMRFSVKFFPLQIMIDRKTAGECGIFELFG